VIADSRIYPEVTDHAPGQCPCRSPAPAFRAGAGGRGTQAARAQADQLLAVAKP
jgi:hypothetical protein